MDFENGILTPIIKIEYELEKIQANQKKDLFLSKLIRKPSNVDRTKFLNFKFLIGNETTRKRIDYQLL